MIAWKTFISASVSHAISSCMVPAVAVGPAATVVAAAVVSAAVVAAAVVVAAVVPQAESVNNKAAIRQRTIIGLFLFIITSCFDFL